jgi:fructokinase
MTKECRVVAIGEVLWDVFDDLKRLGGAPLNFAAHIARLGHPALLISGVGDDPLGKAALAEIKEIGLDASFVQTIRDRPTGTAQVVLKDEGPSFRIERPAAYDAVNVPPAKLSAIAATSPQWLYYGTLFAYQEESRNKVKALASALPGASKFYDVNLRPGCYSREIVCELLALADVVKLNETEMESVAGFAELPQGSIEQFCSAGATRFGWSAAAVTLGASGCAVWHAGEYAEAPGYLVNVADTVGAGDAFSAAMVHGLSREWSARAVADFANQLGSLIASRPGGIPAWTVSELRVPDGRLAPETAPASGHQPPPARIP